VPAVLRRLGGLGMGVVAMLVVRLVLVAHLDPVPPAAVSRSFCGRTGIT
jgi:hypothetical protein